MEQRPTLGTLLCLPLKRHLTQNPLTDISRVTLDQHQVSRGPVNQHMELTMATHKTEVRDVQTGEALASNAQAISCGPRHTCQERGSFLGFS